MRLFSLLVTAAASASLWVEPAIAHAEAPSLCPAYSHGASARTALAQIDVYDGDPADNAALAPDKSSSFANTITNTWMLSPGAKTTIGCSYGPAAPRMMVPLPATTAKCVAKIKQTGGPVAYRPVGITCK